MKGYIYKYTFPDGKVYIGQTKNLEKRRRQHINPSTGPVNTGFWEAYSRFGKYKFEVIKELEYDNESELTYYLNMWEAGYIHQYHAADPNYGYNRTPHVVWKMKEKIILQRKYEDIFYSLVEKRLDPFFIAEYKIKESKEPLTKDEKFLIKEKYKEENPFNVDFFDFDNLDDNELDEFDLDLLYHYLKVVENCIIEDSSEIAKLYIELNEEKILKEERDKTAIVQIDKEGNVIREFHSDAEICQAFNVTTSENIRNVLRGKQKTAYGFYWKYKKDMLE